MRVLRVHVDHVYLTVSTEEGDDCTYEAMQCTKAAHHSEVSRSVPLLH